MLFFEKINEFEWHKFVANSLQIYVMAAVRIGYIKKLYKNFKRTTPHFISSFLIYFIILVELASIAFGGDSRADCSRSLFFIYQSFSILYGNVLRGSETIKKSRG